MILRKPGYGFGSGLNGQPPQIRDAIKTAAKKMGGCKTAVSVKQSYDRDDDDPLFFFPAALTDFLLLHSSLHVDPGTI